MLPVGMKVSRPLNACVSVEGGSAVLSCWGEGAGDCDGDWDCTTMAGRLGRDADGAGMQVERSAGRSTLAVERHEARAESRRSSSCGRRDRLNCGAGLGPGDVLGLRMLLNHDRDSGAGWVGGEESIDASFRMVM